MQVIEKNSGNYKGLRTIRRSKDPDIVENLCNLGKEFLQTYQGQQTLDFPEQDSEEAVKSSIKGIDIEGVN